MLVIFLLAFYYLAALDTRYKRQGLALSRSSLNLLAKIKESKMIIQAIPIYTSQDVSALETAIQEQIKNKTLLFYPYEACFVLLKYISHRMKKAGMKPASSSSSYSDSNSDSNSDYDESMERIHDELTRKEVEAFEAAKSKWADIKIFDDESDEEESKNETPQITNEEIFAALGIFEE
ncbi:hypothetical protein RIR_jg13512.t1 [Rhizophagus irregularis DAOM 181602=DAOM 197198]|nr:hypothetical protein RIR_jg13512.t1 [Rhizophagus irregularis DAOM 181602=DAOM 197198]